VVGADSAGMGVAASIPRRDAPRRARLAVVSRLGGVHALVVVCTASFVARAVAALGKATPDYFPDEYMYAELGRSFAETGRPLVRGAESTFPAFLQPLLTAPAWMFGDVADGYRLVQLIGAFAMSLAAVPVFVLGVRLGLGRGVALGCAALAVAFPALVYTSWILAEPFAYPLFLAAVCSGTIALADRNGRAGIAFVLLAGLAAFTRVQFVVLPIGFFVAALVVGVRGRCLRRELRAQALPLALLAVPLALLLVSSDRIGMYRSFLDLELDPARLGERVAANGMGLMYGSGWILVPGAAIGIALALTRSRSRAELAFGSLSLGLIGALLLQASLYGDLDRIQERYTFYAAPLLVLAFAVFAARGWPWRRAHAILALAALVVSMLVPLTGYAASYGKVQSPFLLGVAELEGVVGDPGTGSLLVAVIVGALSISAIGASLRPRAGTAVMLALALAFCVAASSFATRFDLKNSRAIRDSYLPAERSWVDRSGLPDVALLQGFAPNTEAAAQLFWNRSVDHVLLLPRAVAPDSFAVGRAGVGPDGTLYVDGRPVERPLLVDEWGALVELRGAQPVASAPSYRLWRPVETPRLKLRFEGYFRDGWLAPRGRVALWPATSAGRLEGAVIFSVTPHPALEGAATFRLYRPGMRPIEFRAAPGMSQRLELPVCSRRPWEARFEVDRATWLRGRFVSFRATRPRFVRDAAVCD
jgi:hypothetical protein